MKQRNIQKTKLSIIKKSAVCLTALAIVIVSVFGIYQTTNNQKSSNANPNSSSYTYEELLPKIEQLSKESALALALEKEPNLSLEIGETIPIYDTTNNIVGYSVSYYKNNIPYGYANFDYTTDVLITDFVIQKGADSIYEHLTESFADTSDSIEENDCTEKLYNTTNIDFAVSAMDNNDEVFYFNSTVYEEEDFNNIQDAITEAELEQAAEEQLDYFDNGNFREDFNKDSLDNEYIQCELAEKFKKWLVKLMPGLFKNEPVVAPTPTPEPSATPYPNHPAVFSKLENLVSDVSEPVMLQQYSREKSLLSQKTIMTTTKKYACGLVALTAILNQEDKLINNSIQDTFNKLWTLTNTNLNVYETANCYGLSVECGSTSIADMMDFAYLYGPLVNSTITSRYDFGPSFQMFKSNVDKQTSSVLCYQIKNEGGHGVSILGYANGSIGDKNINYLLAADGWYDDAPKYVAYDTSLFKSTTSISYTFSANN